MYITFTFQNLRACPGNSTVLGPIVGPGGQNPHRVVLMHELYVVNRKEKVLYKSFLQILFYYLGENALISAFTKRERKHKY